MRISLLTFAKNWYILEKKEEIVFMVNRKIDELGRVVIPRDYREALGLTPQTPLTMDLVGDTIVVKKRTLTCALCGKEISEDSKIPLCTKCIRKVKDL